MIDRWMDAMDKPEFTRTGWDTAILIGSFVLLIAVVCGIAYAVGWWTNRRKR